MKRSQVEQVLRAAAAISQAHPLVVVGSQAILLPFPDAPAELLVSRELVLYPALNPAKADLIDGAIGAMSSFDETFGHHADGVGPETAVMPTAWERNRSSQLDGAKHPVKQIVDWARRRAVEARP